MAFTPEVAASVKKVLPLADVNGKVIRQWSSARYNEWARSALSNRATSHYIKDDWSIPRPTNHVVVMCP